MNCKSLSYVLASSKDARIVGEPALAALAVLSTTIIAGNPVIPKTRRCILLKKIKDTIKKSPLKSLLRLY